MPRKFESDEEKKQYERERARQYRLKKKLNTVKQEEGVRSDVHPVLEEVLEQEDKQEDMDTVKTYNSGKYVSVEDYNKLYEECKRFQLKGLEYRRLYENNLEVVRQIQSECDLLKSKCEANENEIIENFCNKLVINK